ncbi:alanine racemase [Paenibacillus sp. 1001270B_150601_E10]|uniref:alanine racemase n=1 Tax=Paenibacillus sp. 1001270B_150601_E10 TaxID=2787079 RepID=UPI00189CF08E|nr:alanine racemase [Paenibacillus sp. 1001270B_150601_E10]
MSTYAYYKSIFEQVPKPFAFVDLDLLDDNARAIAGAAQGKTIRIASKSIRCAEIMRRILKHHEACQGIMCFTAKEAAFLARQGFDDLLLGYPQWQAAEILPLLDLLKEGRSITFMVDCVEQVEHLERLAKEQGVAIPLCIDLDMSVQYPGLRFGVWRSPLISWEDASPVVERIMASSWIRLEGIMGYEAQVAGVGDNVSGSFGAWAKNQLIRALKLRSVKEAAKRRQEIVERLMELKLSLRFVNAGGTGSLSSSCKEAWVTEVTAGSGFYSPALFDHYAAFRYKPAVAGVGVGRYAIFIDYILKIICKGYQRNMLCLAYIQRIFIG